MTPADRGVDDTANAPAGAQRLVKWLWFARVVKSRTLAASLITGGKIRVNREKVDKPSQTVKSGDVVTSSNKQTVRILRVMAPGVRRGPAKEAAALYEDLTPPPVLTVDRPAGEARSGSRLAGSGRPTKRDRRIIDRLQGRE